ncbi:MAG: OB-fold domain-containing protein [Ilumatobacteraceae bacterium]
MDLLRPHPTPTSQPFWDGLANGRVMIQYSPSTDRWVFYPRTLAPGSLANDLEWREISGAGRIHTFTTTYSPTGPQWKDALPQQLAVVELDEGPRLTTALVDAPIDEVMIGLRVRPVIEDRNGRGIALLYYTLA